MKKFLLIAAMACAISASAQKFSKPTATHRFPVKAVAVAKQNQANPRKAAGKLADNQILFGYSGEEAQFFMQIPLGAGEQNVCIGFEGDQLKKYVGCKIVGIRFALNEVSTITSSSVWLSYDPSIENNYIQKANVVGLVDFWNIQNFDTPYTITGNEEEFYVGMTYTSTSSNAYNLITVTGNDHSFRIDIKIKSCSAIAHYMSDIELLNFFIVFFNSFKTY